MDTFFIIEIISVFFNMAFLILLMRENIWCWLCGIIGSALGAYLMFHTQLYSECILYLFYVAIGVYGWYVWDRKDRKNEGQIIEWGIQAHLISIGIGIIGASLMAFFFSRHSDADYPWVDAHTTVFSFIASYMQAHKVLSSWFFWIIINSITIWLYLEKDLNIYSVQMVVYLVLSFLGYFTWKKKLATGV